MTLQDVLNISDFVYQTQIKSITTLLINLPSKELDEILCIKYPPEIEAYIKSSLSCIRICEDWDYYVVNQQIIKSPVEKQLI